MRLEFFSVPVRDGAAAARELNRFLASHKVSALERGLVQDGPNSCWSVCVTVVDDGAKGQGARKGRIDYREVLSAADFAVFAELRSLRKELAQRDGVPAYALFTNEQLAAMARQRPQTADELGRIEGVGASRVEKYATAFLDILRSHPNQTEPADEAGENDS